MKNKKRIISFLICIALSLATFGVYANEGTQNVQSSALVSEPILQNGEIAKILVEQCASLIISQYKDEISRDELYETTLMQILENHPELIEEVYEAMFSSLDEHSRYYTEEEFKYFMENMAGEFVGIGVIINKLDSGLLVTRSTSDSSAAKAGIKQGDIITTVDGVNIVGMDLEKAKTYITGAIDTVVVIGVVRNGEYMEFNVTRRPVIVESARYQLYDDEIGFIQLDTFDETSPIVINEALDFFDSKNVTKIIFDLRYNGGGSATALADICQRIIPSGPVIHFEFKNPQRDYSLYSNCQNPKYELIVLSNEYSASASEAFCGAVQDSKVGVVVGTTTYGKGTMQTVTNFRVGGGVKLTVAEYLTRDKRHIDGVGIKPDFYCEDKIIKMKNASFNDFDFETKPKLGDKGPLVLALNQRLWAMGYDVGLPTDEFTEKTYSAVYQFQAAKGLFPYGVCDITTQLAIENTMQSIEFSDDNIFKTAVDIFKAGSLKNYEKQIK